jgi:hypothetical protein
VCNLTLIFTSNDTSGRNEDNSRPLAGKTRLRKKLTTTKMLKYVKNFNATTKEITVSACKWTADEEKTLTPNG